MPDRTLALMAGIDIPITELQVNVHQPLIYEIAYIGEEEFFSAIQFLCIKKNKFEENPQILQMSNFELMMSIIDNSDKKKERKKCITNLLTLLFPNYKPLFSVNSIILREKNTSNTVLIDGETFNFLQPVLNDIFCIKGNDQSYGEYNPGSKQAQAIAEKLMRGRQRVAAQKGETQKSLLSRYISFVSVGLHMNPKDILNLTVFQLYDLVERYGLYTKWDLDIKVRLAGGKPDDDDNSDWMKNIH